ncbi:Polysaccharide biosynthesis protein [compost metagenome]
MKLKKIFQMGGSKFLKNVFILSSGTILGQAIMMLVLPALTRLYSPEDFGMLGVYMSLLMVLSVGACLRFDLATPIATSEFEALNLLTLGTISATLISVVLMLLVCLFPEPIVGILAQPKMEKFLWLIPLGVWLASVYSAIQFWAVREKDFPAVARTQLTRAVASSATQLIWGVFSPGSLGLLLGYMLYGGFGVFGLAFRFFRKNFVLLRSISTSSLREVFLKFSRFPLYSVPEAFLNTAAVNLPTVIIAALASPREAGYLLLAQRIVSIPIGLLGSSLSRVYLSESGEREKKGELFSFTRSVMFNLAKTGALPFLIIALASPFIFPHIFGEDWRRAGLMVAWLTPAMMLQFVVSPVATVLHATSNNKKAFYLQLGGFILTIGAIYLAAQISPPKIFEFFAVALAIYYLCYLLVVWSVMKTIRKKEEKCNVPCVLSS